MKESQSTGDLRAKLRFWQVTPRVGPEDFESEVWRRIAVRREARRRRARLWALSWALVFLGLLALAWGWRAARGQARPAEGGKWGMPGRAAGSGGRAFFVVENAHEGKESAFGFRC